MKPIYLATVAGVLLAASLGAQARQAARTPAPSDPDAPVPALTYDSALSAHVGVAANAPATPDKLWRKANDAVAVHDGADKQHEHRAGHGSAPTQARARGHDHPAQAKQ